MAERKLKRGKSPCLVMILLLCLIASHRVIAAPLSPGMIYRQDYGLKAPSQMLVDRLKHMVERKQEKIEREIEDLAQEQMEIQALIDVRVGSEKEHQQDSERDPETLPVPAAIYHNGPLHSGKRTSYMALCHFKICNMGRKRQM